MPDRSTPRVAVIGAGAAGICLGAKLRQLGIEQFTIFEQSDGIGGTWHDNVYPGAEVDTAIPFYSFSFHPYGFKRPHPTQREILEYFENLVQRFQLYQNMRFNTGVQRVVWDESAHGYDVDTTDGQVHRFDVVVSAVGALNNPRYPDWPGLDKFEGPRIHSARWDHSVELTGKRVAVAGTGSSGAQIVPAIAAEVEHLYVFQRQPGWIIPKANPEFTAAEQARVVGLVSSRRWRAQQAIQTEKFLRAYRIEGTEANRKSQAIAEKFIAEVFADRPDLAKAVTPDYPFGGKRPIKDSNFYPALLRDNVELVPRAVARVTRNSVIDDLGAEREIDVLITCTGFQVSNFLSTLEVVGRGGQTLHEFWSGEPRAFLGMTVTGFPNFYMMYGPNTSGSPALYLHEQGAKFIVANLKRMMSKGITSIEVRPSVMNGFNHILQKRLARNVIAQYPEVHHYGRTASGRNVYSWDEGMAVYGLLVWATPRLSSRQRSNGRQA